jgi:glucose/arabinose dehydrogenase
MKRVLVAAAMCAACNGKAKPGGQGRTQLAPAPALATAARDGGAPAAPPEPVALSEPPAELAGAVKLERIARRLRRPVQIAAAPGDGARLFIVEEGGRILILRDGAVQAQPFADLSAWVARRHEEQGLLGLAFHPRFADNGKLYLNYTARKDGATHVDELRVDAADPDRVDLATRRRLLRIEQPWANHNGGGLAFGPDGKLYIGMGDGGAAGDPRGNAQNVDSLLGKMLRMDVDADEPAAAIVSVGLRNPWRYAFDRETGDLYIADVGQDKWEFVFAVAAGEIDGKNFGWNRTEGFACFPPGDDCDRAGITPPIMAYDHDTGCSITGGFVYRGKAIPALHGHYFFADFCTGLLRSLRWENGRVTALWNWKPALDPDSKLATISSFGEDADGELYLVSLDGVIWKLVPR